MTQLAVVQESLAAIETYPGINLYFDSSFWAGITYPNYQTLGNRAVYDLNNNLGINFEPLVMAIRFTNESNFTSAVKDLLIYLSYYDQGLVANPCPPGYQNLFAYLNTNPLYAGNPLDLNYASPVQINNFPYMCFRQSCISYVPCENSGYQNAVIPPITKTPMKFNATLPCNCTCARGYSGTFCEGYYSRSDFWIFRQIFISLNILF